MFRSVVFAVLMGLTFQATGVLAVIAPDECVSAAESTENAPSDDCPDCLFCVCCSPLLPTVQIAPVNLVPAERPLPSNDRRTPDLREPAPHRILHVPKSA